MSEERQLDRVSSTVRSWYWECPGEEAVAEHIRLNVLNSRDIEAQGACIWKTRHKEVYVHQVPLELGGGRVAVKDYHEKRFWRYFLRPSLAWREAKGFEVVRRLGIPSVSVLLCGEDRCGVRLKRSYFVTKFVEDTHAMLDFAPGHPFEGSHDQLLALLRENIRYMAMLHAAGYSHGGAHARNFLWRHRADGGVELIWIDLATVKRYHGRARKRLSLDLCDLIEPFELSDEELSELNALYCGIHGVPVVFRRLRINDRKLNICTY